MASGEMKVCGRCFDRHPIEFFNKDRCREDGIYPYCKKCSRAACKKAYRKYETRHRAMKQRWKNENRDRHHEINRQWQIDNPEKVRMGASSYRARRKRATPPWVDKEVIAFTYDLCPPGYHVDHIHPLAGKDFCGLNVPWNLQFLPATEHYKKGTKLLDTVGVRKNV